MPEGRGYKGSNPAQHSGSEAEGKQYYPLGVDPKNEYAHTYSKNTETGTHPYPKNDAAGETAITHAHKVFGERSGARRGPNLENLRS